MLYDKIRVFVLLAAVFGLCGCEYIRDITGKDFFTLNWKNDTPKPVQSYESNVPLLKQPSSIVVCRSHQCAPSKLSMSREYIFNSLLQLFDNNNYQKVLTCQADPQTHTCLENYITLPINVGVVPTNAYIDYIKISDVIINKQGNILNLILNYNITYGGQIAECNPSRSILFAKKINHVILEDSGYNCKITALGTTNVKTVFAIDYIDLDYGYIGGYYSIGFSGPAYGGGNGYMLLRFKKNAYPLSPELMEPTKTRRTMNQNQPLSASPNASDNSSTNDGIYSQGVEIFPIEAKKAN